MREQQSDPSNAVHVSFLLDRSGSMESIRDDVIGGFNRFVRDQQKEPGTCRLTLVQFDSQAPFEVLTDALDVHEVAPLTARRYEPRAQTPLLDAIGDLLDHAERRARGRDEDPVVVVFTDGQENASRRWSQADIFARISRLKERGWTFVFLGANQDSYAEAGGLGFARGSTSNWQPESSACIDAAFEQTSRSLSSMRAKAPLARAAQAQDFFEGVREAEQTAPKKSKWLARFRGDASDPAS